MGKRLSEADAPITSIAKYLLLPDGGRSYQGSRVKRPHLMAFGSYVAGCALDRGRVGANSRAGWSQCWTSVEKRGKFDAAVGPSEGLPLRKLLGFVLDRVDIHLAQMKALTIASMDMKALDVCS